MIISTHNSLRGHGLCGHIYGHAGSTFRNVYNNLPLKRNNIGSAFTLPGDGLNCTIVIVTVVPDMDSSDQETFMKTALLNSLACAEKVKAKSIALPAIGRNFSGFRAHHHCDLLVGALVGYFQQNPSSCIKKVKFVEQSEVTRLALKAILENHTDIELLPHDTPSEILARGPAALEAYLKASQDGTKSVYRTRLMLVGQERVGKTSLMKTITGQSFKESEEITDGVDAGTFVQVSPDKGNPWTVQERASTDFAKHVDDQYTETICALMATRLKNLEDELGSNEEPSESDQKVEQQKMPTESLMQDFGEDQTKQVFNLADESDSRQLSDDTKAEAEFQKNPPTLVPETISQKLLQQLELSQDISTDHQGVSEFQIWDFAGQDVYYTTHQVFLTNRAVYILVFDLCLDLNKPVKVYTPQNEKVESRFHELTGLGFLDFWMQSIFAYATTNKQIYDANKPQLSPPIFIVGTHRDSSDISIDPQERKRLIAAKFQSVSDMVSGKPYEQHVVSRFYAVENSLMTRQIQSWLH
ncbi:uncharacterized protein [Amphiura filiformis]|uniref:uncharacterized protein isoform X1 n=1 Tax=Amphiura filiformis TaxID=82378 RepID=UPI003B21B580